MGCLRYTHALALFCKENFQLKIIALILTTPFVIMPDLASAVRV